MTQIFKSFFAIGLFLSVIFQTANAADYIPFRLLDIRGTYLETPTNLVIRSQEQWVEFYKNATKDNNAIVPVVDFSKRHVVAIAAGARPSGGYSVVVSGIYKSRDYVDVNGYIMKPGELCMTISAITYPAAFLLIPKIQKPFRFHMLNAAYEC